MSTKHGLRAALFVTALLATTAFVADDGVADDRTAATVTQVERPERPDVVVLVIDDMGWEDLELLPTPNLDRLVERGQLFTDFYVDPVCSPSRVSLHAGIYGVRDGVTAAVRTLEDGGLGLGAERHTVGRVLHANGWATACFGKWHVSRSGNGSLDLAPRRFGFETWRAGCRGNIGREGASSQSDWLRIDDGVISRETDYSTIAITRAFNGWWHDEHDGRPRFAVVNYLTPHEPWTQPPSALLPAGYENTSNRRGRFEAAVVALDAAIGHLVDRLDLDATYVFVLPDNGTPHQVPPPSERSRGYKLTVWQGGVHVPMIAVGPGIEPGPNAQLAHVVDLPGTILELCGASIPHGFEDGVSLVPSLFGEPGPRAPVLVQIENEDAGTKERKRPRSDWAVVDDSGMKVLSMEGGIDVFDLRADPRESTPVYAPQTRKRLRAVRDAIER